MVSALDCLREFYRGKTLICCYLDAAPTRKQAVYRLRIAEAMKLPNLASTFINDYKSEKV